ncbi:MAG: YceI family protein [Gammaproteobacteria bacterium]|nr:YceI family protein [Gammaproteobacteria bacterium]
MIPTVKRLLFLLILGFISSTSFAANYQLEPVHTQILFFCDHLGFSKSQGEFLKFDGTFSFDPENPQASTIEVTINTDSIDMDDQKWNDHMKNEDFFDVENFPAMTFTSTNVEPLENSKMNVHGDLTILGKTETVVLNVMHNKSGKHPFSGKYTAGFSATTQIKRSLFGMTYGLPALGDDIEIRLEVEGQKIAE